MMVVVVQNRVQFFHFKMPSINVFFWVPPPPEQYPEFRRRCYIGTLGNLTKESAVRHTWKHLNTESQPAKNRAAAKLHADIASVHEINRKWDVEQSRFFREKSEELSDLARHHKEKQSLGQRGPPAQQEKEKTATFSCWTCKTGSKTGSPDDLPLCSRCPRTYRNNPIQRNENKTRSRKRLSSTSSTCSKIWLPQPKDLTTVHQFDFI